jgi:hypothetical protein
MADRTEGWGIDRRLVALVAAGRGGGSHGDERGHISKEENGGEEKERVLLRFKQKFNGTTSH